MPVVDLGRPAGKLLFVYRDAIDANGAVAQYPQPIHWGIPPREYPGWRPVMLWEVVDESDCWLSNDRPGPPQADDNVARYRVGVVLGDSLVQDNELEYKAASMILYRPALENLKLKMNEQHARPLPLPGILGRP